MAMANRFWNLLCRFSEKFEIAQHSIVDELISLKLLSCEPSGVVHYLLTTVPHVLKK